MKQRINISIIIFLSFLICFHASADQKSLWDSAYNVETKQRFIPVELFTGAMWDGKQELRIENAKTTACYKVIGRDRPCEQADISGPYLTESNTTKIEWVGEKIPYYIRKFKIRGDIVESHFTINNSRDGMVRIYDKRNRWGIRHYDGLGSKFPLGY